MKTDLTRIAQLIAELQAIDTALRGISGPYLHLAPYAPSAKIVVHYVDNTNSGRDQDVSLNIDTAREVLIEQRRGTVGLLKMHGLDVE